MAKKQPKARGAARPARAKATPAKAPPAQEGDKPAEVAKAEAKPVLPPLDAGKAELDANPARNSTLTKDGHLVRE